MKTKQSEFLSFNILNCPFPKQYQKTEDQKNLLISQRLNIPLIPLNLVQEKTDTIQLKLFKNLNEQTTKQDGSRNTQTFKLKNSLKISRLLENNVQKQIETYKDFQREEGISNLKQSLKVKTLDTELKTQNQIRQRITSLPTEAFESKDYNFQNPEPDLIGKRTIFSKQNIQENSIKKSQIQTNYSKVRTQTIDSISNQIGQKQKPISNLKITKKVFIKKYRLKIIAIMVRAVLKLSKKYKFVFQKRSQALKHFRKLKAPHLHVFSSLGPQKVQQKYQDFVSLLFSKIIQLLKSQNYIKDYTDILKQEQKLIVDFQKQRLCFLIKILFQDLELITRKNIIPPFILHSLNLCLFSGKHTQTSQFVINRTKFYSKTVYSLNSQQKVLIALEYLIFTIIAPNILDIANKQICNNQDHFLIIQFYLTAIIILITVFFTNHFKKLPKIEKSNVKPVQLILKFLEEEEEDTQIKTELLISQNLEKNEDMIISGQIKLNLINQIFTEKLKWKNQMTKIFSKLVENIEALIDIENIE
ncbi:unnamed protein product [Paramecium sonneborni]|uniref:Transmembrane protein n=1 Tax=Paramecium sonneborni TaxID=65129 RepID=A0A8S1M7A3_9CILI|nr:unnamed protein product [Paramecium sonneborni]